MRLAGLTFCASLGFMASAAAFEDAPSRHAGFEGPGALAPHAGARSPKTIAAFAVAERLVTLNAYGRRARARINGDADALKHARAMGKVFEGAPQPALVTFEFSVKF
jgi:hypothetical protein